MNKEISEQMAFKIIAINIIHQLLYHNDNCLRALALDATNGVTGNLWNAESFVRHYRSEKFYKEFETTLDSFLFNEKGEWLC